MAELETTVEKSAKKTWVLQETNGAYLKVTVEDLDDPIEKQQVEVEMFKRGYTDYDDRVEMFKRGYTDYDDRYAEPDKCISMTLKGPQAYALINQVRAALNHRATRGG